MRSPHPHLGAGGQLQAQAGAAPGCCSTPEGAAGEEAAAEGAAGEGAPARFCPGDLFV